jgi:hypothetical protein
MPKHGVGECGTWRYIFIYPYAWPQMQMSQLLVPKDSLIANAEEVGDPTDGMDLVSVRTILSVHIIKSQWLNPLKQQVNSHCSLCLTILAQSFLISLPIPLLTILMLNFLTCTAKQPLHSDSLNFHSKEKCSEVLDRLCGLVVRVLGYRSGGPGSIPDTTRKKSSGSGTGSTQPCEYK